MTSDLSYPLSANDLDRRFREAMATFPSGVTIVTTCDDDGQWWGFTATSFCSVSADPPLVLACLSRSAQCYPAFLNAQGWLINVLHARQTALALRFATRGADKFRNGEFVASGSGHPMLKGSCTTLECEAAFKYDAGAHTILGGLVTHAEVADDVPAVYFRRGFHTLEAMGSESYVPGG